MPCSIKTLWSNSNAKSMACWYCSAVLTLLTPTDEPWLAGFTNKGKPSLAVAVSKLTLLRWPRLSVMKGATLRPASRSKRLHTSLSMHTAEPKTSEPTKGKLAKRNMPCKEPSSPKVPCTMGKITSTALMGAALPASIHWFCCLPTTCATSVLEGLRAMLLGLSALSK